MRFRIRANVFRRSSCVGGSLDRVTSDKYDIQTSVVQRLDEL